MSGAWTVREGQLDHPAVQALLHEHLAGMHASSPPGSVYALDLSGLRAPAITFLTLWEGEELLGCGALRELASCHGELKSMRTAAPHLRRGAGARLLVALLALARERGYGRVSLETSSGPSFEAAISLYRRHGFTPGEAFGGYIPSPFNQFLHLEL